jgi:sodium-independent sulfate anion transporter 11
MLAFWLTLFVSSEVGIGSAVGFSICYHLLFMAFHRVRRITNLDATNSTSSTLIPLDTQVFRIHQSMLFFNAYHIKSQCLDAIQTHSSGQVITAEAAKDRNWSVAGDKRAARLRTKAEIVDEPVQIRIVILDLTAMHNIDTTGLTALKDLKADLEKFGGKNTQLRLVGLNERVRLRFARFGWAVKNAGEIEGNDERKKITGIYPTVDAALRFRGRTMSEDEIEITPVEVLVVGDKEKV